MITNPQGITGARASEKRKKMAKVQTTGGDIKSTDKTKVADIRAELGIGSAYQASINGDAVSDDEHAGEYDFVAFAKKVEGA